MICVFMPVFNGICFRIERLKILKVVIKLLVRANFMMDSRIVNE
jgi:hypothetical protein